MIVTFDPVTDRDTLIVIKEDLATIKQRLTKTEEKMEMKFKRFQDTLENIVQALELYAAGGGSIR